MCPARRNGAGGRLLLGARHRAAEMGEDKPVEPADIKLISGNGCLSHQASKRESLDAAAVLWRAFDNAASRLRWRAIVLTKQSRIRRGHRANSWPACLLRAARNA